MNIVVHISLQIMFFSGYMPRSGIAELYGSSIFRFLRNLHTVVCNDYNNVLPDQQHRKVLFSPYPVQDLFFVDDLVIVILTDVRWYLIVLLICISLIISDIEHLLMCLLPICCLWRSVGLGPLPIFEWVFCFDAVKNHELFVSFRD